MAAWRELARRLAHELKNPLFPLQLTVENLIRARQQSPELFEEMFREGSPHSAGGDFESKSDHRTLQRILQDAAAAVASLVQVNQRVESVMRLFQAQFRIDRSD